MGKIGWRLGIKLATHGYLESQLNFQTDDSFCHFWTNFHMLRATGLSKSAIFLNVFSRFWALEPKREVFEIGVK